MPPITHSFPRRGSYVVRILPYKKEYLNSKEFLLIAREILLIYCKVGVVDMFSDASDFQLAGTKFEEEQVCWDTRFKVSLTEGEKGLSSTYRELRDIEECLRANGRNFKGKTVR